MWEPFVALARELGYTPSAVMRECVRRFTATRGIWFHAKEVAIERGDDLDKIVTEFLRRYIDGSR